MKAACCRTRPAGEATANETSETFMMMRSGSGSESTSVAQTPIVSQPSVVEGFMHRCADLSPPGDSSLTWLVDSGATCHIVALRFLETPSVAKASRDLDANGS